MINSSSNNCIDLEICLIRAFNTIFPSKSLLWTQEDRSEPSYSLGNKIEELITDLQKVQDQKTIDGIAYRVGQSFFYEYLYRFDQQLSFSDLSFKLQSFENKKKYFLSTFADQFASSKLSCEWKSKKNTLILKTDPHNQSTIEWFIRGMFAEMLFWLSNGKLTDVKIEQEQNESSTTYQIKIIEW